MSNGERERAVNDCVVVQLNQFLQLSVTRDCLSSFCSLVKDRRLSFQFKFGFGFGFGERYKILRSCSVSVSWSDVLSSGSAVSLGEPTSLVLRPSSGLVSSVSSGESGRVASRSVSSSVS